MATKQHTMTLDRATVTGLQALSHIAADEDLFGAFLDQAGTDAGDVKSRATDPDFLGFVLDFLMQDDGRVIGFAATLGIPPEDVPMARRALPGGDVPEWT